MFYKFISLIDLVIVMLEQNFKPISIGVIKSNIEYIKMFGSKITLFDIDEYLDKLVSVVKLDNKHLIGNRLSKLSAECKTKLSNIVKPEFKKFVKLTGGNIQPGIEEYSNYKVAQSNTNAYFGKPTKLYLSDKPNKKYYVLDDKGKKIYFGEMFYKDYTLTGDEELRKKFKSRNWKWANNPKYSASSLAYHILW